MISIDIQLEILANKKIMIPGCEPVSSFTSPKLANMLSQSGCGGGALVDLADVLNAIPGSYVRYGYNYNRGGYRQSWLILPGRTPGCPCATLEDWFTVLKKLPKKEPETTEEYDLCNMNSSGFCPSPDFKDAEPPLKSPYREEGGYFGDVGILPPVPPWSPESKFVTKSNET